MARVLVATPILSGCFDSLNGHELVKGSPGSDADAEALICDPTQTVDLATQELMPSLRLIAVAGTGADAIDHHAAKARGITVVTAGHVLAETTADIAFGLIIAASRLMHDAEVALRAGRWQGWRFVEDFGQEVNGAMLGLVGFGSIAQAVARRASGFRMTVLHHTRHDTGQVGWVEDLDELLGQSDIVSVHVPLSSETRHLIDRRRMALLKPSAVLVNTARGAVVDEEALADALEAGELFAAGLDVYENEPKISPRLLSAPRTVLLPHIGSATLRTRQAMLRSVAEKVRDFFDERQDSVATH
ncbi:MAG: NAD(P)-dependent oxidoreductase [Solirubrobacteraceae bacterium]|jgi:glyoxylate reductase